MSGIFVPWLFDFDLGVAQTIAQSVTYAPAKFGAATFNGLGEDTTTRNMTYGHTHIQTDRWIDRQTVGPIDGGPGFV